MRRVLSFLCFVSLLFGEEEGHMINFRNVPIEEFIRFVSRVAKVNFVFDEELLNFDVTFVSGKPADTEHILTALEQIMEKRGIKLVEREGYYHLVRMSKEEIAQLATLHALPGDGKLAAMMVPEKVEKKGDFCIYKLKYHQGGEIVETMRGIAAEMKGDPTQEALVHSIQTLQWVKGTNSLLYNSSPDSGIDQLIAQLDQPQKQVFIEVLVIETSVKEGLEFGLQWGSSGQYQNQLGYATGNFPQVQNVSPTSPPTGHLVPLGRGFDFGVIGDLIFHRGRTFFSLGTLVSALQQEGKSSIILNQKIITQDNKSSELFVGDNIPFTGSIVETVGASQQTTSNIEYRDIGVKLKITPLLGENQVITLDIQEEISEAHDDHFRRQGANGILTTKTHMATKVHVPNKHFLVLSGVVRNSKIQGKTGIPCLGGFPLIGALFSKHQTNAEKRNVLVFVRPEIINTVQDFEAITGKYKELVNAAS